jgi:SAM-dependent methyltransferase
MGSSRVSKHTVLSSGLHDADIRPPALLSEFRRLSIRDAATYFPAGHREAVPCAGCGTGAPRPAFATEGFAWVQCGACRSVYVSPRPTATQLERYYAESEASRFRAAEFADATAAQRRHHQLRNNALWMAQVAEAQGLPLRPTFGDFRTYAAGLFEEVAALGFFGELYSLDPQYRGATSFAAALDSGSTTRFDAISAFEKLEHQFCPKSFLEALRARLKPGGLLFLTTRTISGFDLQTLWDKAPYIFAPEHLNLLSIEGIELALQRSGFELIELSTPGQLDVELVRQTCSADPSIELPPFFSELLARRDRFAHADFQEFLQKHRLSSHVRVAARKALPIP